jgi:glucose-6-phosphate 1-dehydrogenase
VHEPSGDEVGAYERLLTDALTGDATLFVRADAVEAAWGPAEADRLAADLGGWHVPAP